MEMQGPWVTYYCEQNLTKYHKPNSNQPLYFHWNPKQTLHIMFQPYFDPIISTGTKHSSNNKPYSLSKVNTCQQNTKFTLVNSFSLTCSHFHIQSYITQLPV